MLEKILGRAEYQHDLSGALASLSDQRIMITGSDGSIGTAVQPILRDVVSALMPTDIDECNVTSGESVLKAVKLFEPTMILHLAGAKHAPAGECDPIDATMVNTLGTQNIVAAAQHVGARVVMASTCKACDPETAYGASKLLAERIVLNSKGCVARFYNVVETSGNVFSLWRDTPESEPLKVMPCRRFFISLREAVALTVFTLAGPSGRYVLNPGVSRSMTDIASVLYPGRDFDYVSARRGDRLTEPLSARSERLVSEGIAGLYRVRSLHDAVWYP